MRRPAAFVLALVLAAGAPAAAQAPAAAPARTCALHIWADPHIDKDISGIFPGGLLARAETGDFQGAMKRGKTNVLKLLLTPELLVQALRDSSIGPRLGIDPGKFILETDPKAARDFSKSPTSAAEGCRYGFVFNIIKFEKSAVYGRRLSLFYKITDRTRIPKPRNMQWYNSEKLSAFVPTQSDEEIAAVLRDGVRRVVDDIVAEKFPATPAAAPRR